MPRKLIIASAVLLSQLLAATAFAHHPTGGMLPASFMHGLLSGIGHPILGIDHLAFVVGIGVLAAIAGRGLVLPAVFVLAMTVGLGLHLASVNISYSEVWLGLSVVLIGLAILYRQGRVQPRLEGIAFSLAGLFHGYAFAETVIGAEPTPIIAYIIGLAATQLTIAAIAWRLAGDASSFSPYLSPIVIRAVGGVIALVGIVQLAIQGMSVA